MPQDKFAEYSPGLESPATSLLSVTPDDDRSYTGQPRIECGDREQRMAALYIVLPDQPCRR